MWPIAYSRHGISHLAGTRRNVAMRRDTARGPKLEAARISPGGLQGFYRSDLQWRQRPTAPAPISNVERTISNSAQGAFAGIMRGGAATASGTLAVDEEVSVVEVLLTVAVLMIGFGPE